MAASQVPQVGVRPRSAAGESGVEASRRALASVMQQLAELVAMLTDEQYVARPCGRVTGSIGGHVRHCIDHLALLLAAIDSGELNYDLRERGGRLETDRSAAAARIQELVARLERTPARLDAPLRMSITLTRDGRALETHSTLGRELAFVQSHTIHHSAMIAVIAHSLGQSVPPEFGYAPATLEYLDHHACAPSPSSR